MSIRSASVQTKLDAAGSFSVELPLADPRAAEVLVGRYWRHYVEGLGMAFAGLIEDVRQTPEASLVFSGSTILGELLFHNTLLNRSFDQIAVEDIVDDLLGGTGWWRSGGSTSLQSVRFDGESILRSLNGVLSKAGHHYREHVTESPTTNALVRTLEVGDALGQAAGVTLMGGLASTELIDDEALAYVEQLSVEHTNKELWNWIVPLGAGEGAAQLTLEYQTRLPNLLVNPSFEGNFDNWVVGSGSYLIDKTDRRVHGISSARLTSTGGAEAKVKQASIPVVAGQEYRLQAWAWQVSGTGTLNLIWRNSGGGQQGSAFDVVTTSTGAWELLDTGVKVAPAGAVTAELSFRVPLGVFVGQVDLMRFWRTASDAGEPYDIFTELTDRSQPIATLQWYLQDVVSVSSQGQRQRFMVAKDVVPLNQTKASLQAAANSLYELAAAQLALWVQQQAAYSLNVRGLSHEVRPGDTVILRWRGVAERSDGTSAYLTIDDEVLYILELSRKWDAAGTEQISMVVSNLDLALAKSQEVVIGKLEDTSRIFRTHVQQTLSHHDNGPFRDELDSSHPMVFQLNIANSVIQLLRCLITFKGRAIRSPVNVVSSGGGSSPTSDAGGSSSPTTSSGGGQTSSSGGNHAHQMFLFSDQGSWADPPSKAFLRGRKSDLQTAADIHVGFNPSVLPPDSGGIYTQSDDGDHTHTVSNHTHTVTIASHAHIVTIASHAHNLSFGIFESSSPSNIQLWIDSVNRTTELLGPWSSTGATLDITAYFFDNDEHVVRGNHTIEFRVPSGLGRVEAMVHWEQIIAPLKIA